MDSFLGPHLNWCYPSGHQTESKSVSLGWRWFETLLQEVVFSHQNTP
jgi:hypothetical protein